MSEPPWRRGCDSPTAFVGIAKNAGKTTALGRWAAERAARGATLGLLSVGLDGESRDAILGTDKPDIAIPAGHLVAAGEEALERASARFEYVEALGCSTALGRAYVARTLRSGTAVLGGLRHRKDVRRAVAALRAASGGSQEFEVFIDGAYGRTVCADGRIAGSVVVATGAVAGDTPAEILESTVPLVERLRLEEPDGLFAEVAECAEREQRAFFVTPEGGAPMPYDSALRGLPASAGDWPSETRGVVIPGAVTDGVIEELERSEVDRGRLVAMAPSSFQVGDEAWTTLRASDWRVRLRHPVSLEALAINPAGPRGHRLDESGLRRTFSRRWGDIPIVDARREPCISDADVEG